jgi:predicted RNA-binding protein with RPS1 domain
MNGAKIVHISSLNNGYVTAIDSRQKIASEVS